MTCRLYIVPVEGDGTRFSPFKPKYFGDPGAPLYASIQYGRNELFLVASDTTTPQHNFLVGKSDVIAIPTTLDTNLTAGQVTAIRDFLINNNIPHGWVNTTHTPRTAVRNISAMFLFMQRVAALAHETTPFAGIALSTQWSQLNETQQSLLLTAAQQLGYPTESMSGTHTIGYIFGDMAKAWGQKPIAIGCATI